MRRLSVIWSALALWCVLVSVAVAADVYNVDPVHSTVGFRIKHLGISTVQGQFTEYTGKAVFDPDPAKCSVEVTVQAKSVDTSNKKRDEHLRGAEFFNVEKFPTLLFKSTAVKKIDDATYEVTGDFTLLGTTKPITIKFTDVAFGEMKGEKRAGGETKFQIKRSDYGMKSAIGPIGDNVDIHLLFEAIKAA